MGIAYNPSTVMDGLVLYLDAANPSSYPGSGTTWTDLSGLGNNGTLVNMDGTNLNSANGGSLTLDGNNEYITLSNMQSYLISASQFTYSTFIKITGSSTFGMFFSFGQSDNYANDITFYYYPTDGTINFQVNNGGDGAGSINYSIGSWNDISVVYDGTQATNSTRLKVYINGVQKTLSFSYTVPATTSSVAFTNSGIGAYSTASYGASTFMSGSISTTKLYNRALTASEISQNFNALRARFGI